MTFSAGMDQRRRMPWTSSRRSRISPSVKSPPSLTTSTPMLMRLKLKLPACQAVSASGTLATASPEPSTNQWAEALRLPPAK